MLGGLSILLCVVMHLANFFRYDMPVLDSRFLQMGVVVSTLSLFCNHPHFMISYRFGYGRGLKFILQNWFSLILVPIALVTAYTLSYFFFNTDVSDSIFLAKVNNISRSIGLSFNFGQTGKLGEDLVGVSIWLMYLTVGWHYCKQVYGCMMVYAFYDGYKLENWQKGIFKWSAISVAIYQFVYVTNLMDGYSANSSGMDPRFQGFHLSSLGLPAWMAVVSTFLVVSLLLMGLAVIGQIYWQTKKLPSVNFLVPWIAFYVWWVPVGDLPEYYLLLVPFFHSLQYLPFALRLENEKIVKNKFLNLQASVRILILLLVGFLSFELIPSILDKSLGTDVNQTAWFFATVIAVFINIHHFFIDSVVWKFKNKTVNAHLLYNN